MKIGADTKAKLRDIGRRIAEASETEGLSNEDELMFLAEMKETTHAALLTPPEALLAARGAETSRLTQEWAFLSLGRTCGIPEKRAARLIERCAKALGAETAAKAIWGPEANAWGLCRLAETAGAESETEESKRALDALAESFEREWRKTGRVPAYFMAAAAMETSGAWLDLAREMATSRETRVEMGGEITAPKKGGIGWREYESKDLRGTELTPGGLRALWDNLLSRGAEGKDESAGEDLGIGLPNEAEEKAGRATAMETLWGTYIGLSYWSEEKDWPNSAEEAREIGRARREAATMEREAFSATSKRTARL